VVPPHLVPALQLSFRAAAGAGVAYALAELLHLQFPLYAMIAAVIVTDLAPTETRKLGVRRIGGTVIGSLMGALVTIVLPPGALTIAFGIFLTMFITHIVGLAEAARVAGYLCGLVLLQYADDPWNYSFWRLVETALGIGVAMAVSFVPKLLKAPAEPPKT
jgi:uncharacterized membrane protein YccC